MHAILTKEQAKQYSPAALAFFGDSVYEVMVRRHLLLRANQLAAQLHAQKVHYVCASFQAQGYDAVLLYVTDEEAAILKRGRNVDVTVPRHTHALDYHKATELEALFGYLSCIGEEARLDELFAIILECVELPEA